MQEEKSWSLMKAFQAAKKKKNKENFVDEEGCWGSIPP